ncbi:Flp family type IVb pilin [Vibrio sp. RC27]
MLTKLFVKASLALEAKKQRGVTAIEYAIIGVAVSAIVLAVFNSNNGLKGALSGAISTVSGNIDSANTTGS